MTLGNHSTAKRIAGLLGLLLAAGVVIGRLIDTPQQEWIPLLVAASIFVPIHIFARRFMRGPLSTAVVGMLLGVVCVALILVVLGIPTDALLLLGFGAAYGVFVTFIYEGDRLDAEAAGVTAEQVPPNSSSSGREEA